MAKAPVLPPAGEPGVFLSQAPAAIEEGEWLEGMDFAGQTVTGNDLAGVELSGCRFVRCRLTGCGFAAATFPPRLY